MDHQIVHLDCANIGDRASFHREFARIFGFPAYYGNNMDAWIDCMTHLDDMEAGMSSITVARDGVVTLDLQNIDQLKRNHPDLYTDILECAAFVNWRRMEVGDAAVLCLSFHATNL